MMLKLTCNLSCLVWIWDQYNRDNEEALSIDASADKLVINSRTLPLTAATSIWAHQPSNHAIGYSKSTSRPTARAVEHGALSTRVTNFYFIFIFFYACLLFLVHVFLFPYKHGTFFLIHVDYFPLTHKYLFFKWCRHILEAMNIF